MGFDKFLSQAWEKHAQQTELVAKQLPDGLKLIEKNEQIPQMARLITHVFGEHLGQWQSGILLNQKLKSLKIIQTGSESEQAVDRFIAALEIASGEKDSLNKLSTSDQISALTTAASALNSQKDVDKALLLFCRAIELAQDGLNKTDPANRALAVAGNNIASSLEEKTERADKEIELMVLAAETGRKYWEIAGTYLEIERAEYRLSMTYLKANNLNKSLKHAQNCIEISKSNKAEPLELFFGFEALALVEKAKGNQNQFSEAVKQVKVYFEKLSVDDKTWCESSLKKLLAT